MDMRGGGYQLPSTAERASDAALLLVCILVLPDACLFLLGETHRMQQTLFWGDTRDAPPMHTCEDEQETRGRWKSVLAIPLRGAH